jgi:hypothetical protein
MKPLYPSGIVCFCFRRFSSSSYYLIFIDEETKTNYRRKRQIFRCVKNFVINSSSIHKLYVCTGRVKFSEIYILRNANKLIHLNQTSLARNNKKDQNGEFIQMSRRQRTMAKNKARNWYESQTT